MSLNMLKDIKPNTLAILVFLCGATNDISMQIIGQFYLSEMLVFVLAVLALFLWRGYESFDAQIFRTFMLAGWIMLLGYVLSDIYVGTQPSQYLRGWGRTILIITDCFAIMLLAMKGKQNLWWFMLGSGIGGVILLYLSGVPLHSWKLGYGERALMIFLPLLIVTPRKFWVMGLLGYGLFNIVLDYRSLGAGLVAAAAILMASTVRKSRRLMVIGVAGVVMSMALVITMNMTQDEFKAHRIDSNIGRTSAIIISLRAIMHSPLIGYGSWTVNQGLADELREEILDKRAQSDPSVDFSRLGKGSGFQSHSQIIQSWVEGGVLGAAFFFLYGYRLYQSVLWCTFHRRQDVFSPIFLYMVVMGVWNLFMSPALGSSRMQIALAVGVIVVLLIEKKSGGATAQLMPEVVRENNQQPRLLKRARPRA